MALQTIDKLLALLDTELSTSTTVTYSATQVRLKGLPGAELPNFGKHFEIARDVKLPKLGSNQLLVETEYLSVDPYMRSAMKTWYKTPTKQMYGHQVSKVIESNVDEYKPGDYVYGAWSWSTLNIIDAKSVQSIVPPNVDDEKLADVSSIPHSYYIGSVGMPGMTAYYGLLCRGEIKKGENILISGAAGAVGSICGQIAKHIYGCHVVGICGTKEKVQWLKDLSFDGAINYKEYGDDFAKIQERLKAEFPNGIDLFWDNCGGPFTAATWDILNVKARVIVCGQISHYNSDNTKATLRPMLHKLIYKEIDIRGILVTNFKDQSKFYNDMIKWISSGQIKVKQTVVDGFENAIQAFIDLFSGKNIGKMVVKCV